MASDNDSLVTEDKLEALKFCRDNERQFFSTTIQAGKTATPIYIAAKTEHQAQLAVSKYLMPLYRWDNKKQLREYTAALEDAIAERDALLKEQQAEDDQPESVDDAPAS